MALSVVRTSALDGVYPRRVDVQTHIGRGLPSMSIVGLPKSAVRESKDRVRAALDYLGFSIPQVRVTVNLAPADVPKHGGSFDLPIAIGLLVASGQLPQRVLDRRVFLGELGLGGELRAVRGVLPIALSLAGQDLDLVLPLDNRDEAALSSRTRVLGVESLAELREQLLRDQRADTAASVCTAAPCAVLPDLADVRGQAMARRALEIAAAGRHSLLMCGPPGSGKSMMAQRLPGLLPPLSEHEAMEAASIHSISHGGLGQWHWRQRPFRAPHHTVSAVALIGGGSGPAPGEVSLAHNGVLFLDELSEFPRGVLDVLREPLESGRVSVSRAARQADFPARFQLLAAMNPCPCGYGLEAARCRCRTDEVRRYQARLSGPLLDRIDMAISLQAEYAGIDDLPSEPTAVVKQRVLAAMARHDKRRQAHADRHGAVAHSAVPLLPDASAKACLRAASAQLALSQRACNRVLRVASTIADLDAAERIGEPHVTEALAYRGPRRFTA